MDLIGKPQVPGSKHKEASTTAAPNYPQVVCPPSYMPITTEFMSSLSTLWVQTSTYVSCVSLVNPTSNDTTEAHWTRQPCSLRTETYSRDEKVSVLTFCNSLTSASTPSAATATTTSSPLSIATSSSSNGPTATPTSIASPGLDWQPPRNNKIIAIAVTVPLVSIALLCVAVYIWVYKRKKNHGNDHPGSGNGGASAATSSAPAAVPGAPGRLVSGSTGNPNATRAVGSLGIGVRSEWEERHPWTNRGYRGYGDGKRRPPPQLSQKALRRISGVDGDGYDPGAITGPFTSHHSPM